MIEHAENPDPAYHRIVRARRPELVRTLCSRWVDVVRIALRPETVTCTTCRNRQATA